MWNTLSFLISFGIAVAAATVLYSTARRFVRNRLRYVDAVQKGIAPWVAGGAVLLVGSAIAPLLPFVGIGTAISAAFAFGSGVAAGARDIRNGTLPIVYGS